MLGREEGAFIEIIKEDTCEYILDEVELEISFTYNPLHDDILELFSINMN